MPDKRPDESDDFRKRTDSNLDCISDPILSTELEVNPSQKSITLIHESAVSPKIRQITSVLVSLLCGYELQDDENCDDIKAKSALQQKDEAKRRLENFHSITQTKFEKWILNLNLALILLIAISLYVFFSIPPEYTILKPTFAAHFNSTS